MGIPGLGGPGPYCIGMMGREYPGGGPFTFQFDAEGSIGGIGWPYPIPGGMGPNSPGGGGFIIGGGG